MSVRSAKDVVLQMENARLLAHWEPALEGLTDEVWNKYSDLQDDATEKWNNCLQQMFGTGETPQPLEGVFAQLSADNPVAYADLHPAMQNALRKTAATRMLETFVDASIVAFQFQSGAEVLWDFLRSKRVRKDLDRVIAAHFERGLCLANPKMGIILRAFHDLPANCEFRVFVKHGLIVAVSQYDHLLYCPEAIVAQQDLLKKLIKRFVDERILPNCMMEQKDVSVTGTDSVLQTNSFVIDLAIPLINKLTTAEMSDEAVLDSMLIIEFNPMLSITSGCLFDWNVTEDNALLSGDVMFSERDSFPLRVVTAPLTDPVFDLKRTADCYREISLGMLNILWPEL